MWSRARDRKTGVPTYGGMCTTRAAGTSIHFLFGPYYLMHLSFFCFRLICFGRTSAERRGPGLGDSPGDPPPGTCLGRAARRRACCCALPVSLDTGRSRSRAVSLLTGVHVPHLSFIYLKKYPPQIKVYSQKQWPKQDNAAE